MVIRRSAKIKNLLTLRIVQRGLEAEETKNLLSSVRSFSPKEREVLVPSSAESLEVDRIQLLRG